MKKYLLFTISILLFGIRIGFAQVSQFPQIYINGNGTTLLIRSSTTFTSGNEIGFLSLTSSIGAESLFAYSENFNWIRVCIPSTSSTNNYPNYGYMGCNYYYTRIKEANNYAKVITSSNPLGVRTCAGCTSSYVTFSGQNIYYGKNSIVALTTGIPSSGWYEIYLPNNIYYSQATGWVDGTYLSINSSPTDYRIVGGAVCNSPSFCSYLGNINNANVSFGIYGSTTTSDGYYQYKLPYNQNATISCTESSYNTSTPTSYSYTANIHNYTKDFVLSNSTSCTIPSNPSNPTSNSPQTGSVTLTRSGNPPTGITWYWQGTSCGTDMTYSGTTYTATLSGTYYIRAYDNTGGCWSNGCGSVSVTVTSCTTPSNPSNPTSNSPQTGSVTLTRSGNPPTGITWYWQGTSCGTDMTYSGTTYTATLSGTYYIRAYDNTGGCWSSGCGSANVTVSSCTTPSNPSNPTNNSPQTGSVTLTRSGNPPSGITWYWQGTSCGTDMTYSGTTYTATSSGKYYIRAYDNTGCWSNDCGSNSVIVNSASISISDSIIPTWQRVGDAFNGSITVNLSNAGSSPTWHIEADAFDEKGVYKGNVKIGMGTTSNTISFTSSQVSNYIKQGWHFTWNAVLESNNYVATATQQTNIIEAQWVKKNVVLYNASGQELKIPMKYVKGATRFEVGIQRYGLYSNSTEDLHPNNPMSGCLYGKSFCNSYSGSDGYLHIPIGSDNNLNTIAPGVFQYTVGYLNNALKVVEDGVGVFDLTKIGNVNNSMNTASDKNKVVVLVGGISNTLESDIIALGNNYDFSSQKSFSIANELSVNPNYKYNTWYIAQGNVNSVQKNAYNLGIALEKIRELNGTNVELHVIAHSKGGLEIRIMMDGKGEAIDGSHVFTPNPIKPFLNTTISQSLKSVSFLGTPHLGINGVSLDYLKCISRGSLSWNEYKTTEGVQDLDEGSSPVINYLEKFGSSMLGTRIANFTGYGDPLRDGDGGVNMKSSENPNIRNMALLKQYYIRGGQVGYNTILHATLPNSFVVNDARRVCRICPHYYSCNDGTVSMMERIRAIINNNGIYPDCAMPDENTWVTAQISRSILSGAIIKNKNIDGIYEKIGISDENGLASFYLETILIGDTILIEAPGSDKMPVIIDSNLALTKFFSVALLKNHNFNNKIQYPSLKLVNQNPINTSNSTKIEATGQNVLKFEINNPFNQDTAFIPLKLSNNVFTTKLDTGYNYILVKFIGKEDTVTLAKEVYYLPDNLMNQYTYNVSIKADSASIGTKVYVNNQFVKEIKLFTDTIPVLKGRNAFKFIKFGYTDSLVLVDSATTISVSLHLFHHSYSSLNDSSIVDFPAQGKIQYRKNVTVMDTAKQSIISIKQYDDSLSGMGLKPKSRNFVMRHLNTNWSAIRFAVVLDQIENLSKDSIYLMKITNDTSFTKIPFDSSAVVAGYDSTVQKLTYNSITFNSGTATKEALVILKKQAPIVYSISPIKLNGNDSLKVSLSKVISNPDSIHNDMTVQILNDTSKLKVFIVKDSILIKPNSCWVGQTNFTIKAQHDGLIKNNSITVTVAGKPTIIANGATTFCNGDSVRLSSSIGIKYKWSTGDTVQTIAVKKSGNYMLTVTDKNKCHIVSDTVVIKVKTPVLTVDSSSTICLQTGKSTLVNDNSSQSITVTEAITSTAFDPIITGAVLYKTHYIYTDTTGCTNFAALLLSKSSLPVTLSNLIGESSDNSIWNKSSLDGFSFTPNQTQTNSITITDSKGCVEPSTLSLDDITLYPNPTNNSFTIIINKQTILYNLEISNSIGDILLQKNVKNPIELVDLSSQAAGVYFVKFQLANTSIIKKIIKQ